MKKYRFLFGFHEAQTTEGRVTVDAVFIGVRKIFASVDGRRSMSTYGQTFGVSCLIPFDMLFLRYNRVSNRPNWNPYI